MTGELRKVCDAIVGRGQAGAPAGRGGRGGFRGGRGGRGGGFGGAGATHATGPYNQQELHEIKRKLIGAKVRVTHRKDTRPFIIKGFGQPAGQHVVSISDRSEKKKPKAAKPTPGEVAAAAAQGKKLLLEQREKPAQTMSAAGQFRVVRPDVDIVVVCVPSPLSAIMMRSVLNKRTCRPYTHARPPTAPSKPAAASSPSPTSTYDIRLLAVLSTPSRRNRLRGPRVAPRHEDRESWALWMPAGGGEGAMGVVGGGWVQGALWRFESSVCKEGEREGLFLGTGACTFSNGTSSLGRADEQVASSSSNWPGHLQPNLGQIGLYSLVLIGILIVLEIVFRCPRFHYAHRCGLDNILVLLNGGIPIAMPTVTLVIRAQQLAKYQVIVTGITAIEERAGRIMRSSDTSRTRTTNKLTIDKSTLKTYSSYSPEEVSLYAAYASRTENMDAIDTCRIVLSERGLSTIVRAIRQSRVIFQRVRNYSICTRAVTIRIVIGFAVMAFSFKFDFPPFMVLIIALLNDATIMTLSLDGVVPSSTFDSWDLGEIITYAFAYGLYLAAGTIAFYCVIIYTTLFTDKFGVAQISQALIFITRSHGFFFMERPSVALFLAFCLAQLISSIIAAYGDWGFTSVRGVSGGWVWNIVVWFFPVDCVKFAAWNRGSGPSAATSRTTRTAPPSSAPTSARLASAGRSTSYSRPSM
ncbi:hypothetical protein JCM8097_003064 [Rhodosporidiobolus ruineniae]